jgi:hypothetical protein
MGDQKVSNENFSDKLDIIEISSAMILISTTKFWFQQQFNGDTSRENLDFGISGWFHQNRKLIGEKKNLRKMLILATIEFKVKQTLGFSSSQQESWFYQHLIYRSWKRM